jgi:hypothetical protein
MATYWAIVILAATSFAAQTADAQDRPGREQVLKVSGCIAQASRTGCLTDDTGAGNVPSPSTVGVEANSSEPVNAYMLLGATPPGGRRRAARSGWLAAAPVSPQSEVIISSAAPNFGTEQPG